MDVSFSREGDSLVVMIEGEIDHHTASRVRERIDNKFLMEPVKNMILDLSRVTFMDSAGIGLILGRMNRVTSIGGKVTLRKPKPEIQRLLRMSKLEALVDHDA